MSEETRNDENENIEIVQHGQIIDKSSKEITELKLGNSVICKLSDVKTDEDLRENESVVYVDTKNINNTDILQLQYNSEKSVVTLGQARVLETDNDSTSESKFKDIYVPVIVGSDKLFDEDTTVIGGYETSEVINPTYYAVIELLDVLKVTYDDAALSNVRIVNSGNTKGDIVGFRYEHTGEDYEANCIRIYNTTQTKPTSGNPIYLKVVSEEMNYDTSDQSNYTYGEVGRLLSTVSKNAVNQATDALLKGTSNNTCHEWYFPKKIVLKKNHIYVIFPHHDNSYRDVTESDAKLRVRYNESGGNVKNGLWLNERLFNPTSNFKQYLCYAEFCYKNPTTVVMTK